MSFSKRFPDADIVVKGDNNHIEVVSNGNLVHNFDFKTLASDTGKVTGDEVVLHTPSNGNDKYIGVVGIGRHNDIYYLMHLSPSGQNEWIVDSDIGSHLRCYDCGVKGLKSTMAFNEGVAKITFGVASPPCVIEISFNGGQWTNSDGRGFC